MAAPTATASSGFTSSASGTEASSLIILRTIGMRVMPPTSKILFTCDQSSFASLHHDVADRLALLDEVPGHLLKLLAGDLDLDALAVVALDDRRAVTAGELDLGRQRPALQILVTLQVEQRILAVRAIKLLGHVIDEHIVPILAAEPVIAIGRHHLEAMPFDPHERDVEGAAAEVEDEHRLVFVQLVQSVGQRRGGRFVDDLQDVQARRAGRR